MRGDKSAVDDDDHDGPDNDRANGLWRRLVYLQGTIMMMAGWDHKRERGLWRLRFAHVHTFSLKSKWQCIMEGKKQEPQTTRSETHRPTIILRQKERYRSTEIGCCGSVTPRIKPSSNAPCSRARNGETVCYLMENIWKSFYLCDTKL